MNQRGYSLLVLIGASSYGISASVIKLTIGAGYTSQVAMGGQYLFGALMLGAIFLFSKKKKTSIRQLIELFFLGMLISLTGIFYARSLSLVPASVAVIMLFQFTWIGILIEAIHLKKVPSRKKSISIFLLWIGTLLAAGIGSQGFDWKQNIEGIMFGILSAISFAFFIFFSGKVANGVPAIQRSTVISAAGLAFVLIIISPAFIMNGTLINGLWKYGIMLGLFGLVIPVVFFAIGTPKIDSGTAMIAGAAELPAAIVAAMLILGDQITFIQTLGIILIMIGIAIPQVKFPNSRMQRGFHGG